MEKFLKIVIGLLFINAILMVSINSSSEIEIKLKAIDTKLVLYYHTLSNQTFSPDCRAYSENYEGKASFNLSSLQDLSGLRIDFANTAQELLIEDIRVKKGLFYHRLNFKKLANSKKMHAISSLKFTENGLLVSTMANDPFIILEDSISHEIIQWISYPSFGWMNVLMSVIWLIFIIFFSKKTVELPTITQLKTNILSVLFIGLCLIIGILQLFTASDFWTGQVDRNIKKPSIEEGKDFTTSFEEYYNSIFPWEVTGLKCAFYARSLGVTPIPQKVVMGKDEWLFLSKNVSDSKGNYQLPSTQIYQLALKYYRQQEWFDERNIPYYLAIAPNKTSFYPEYIVTSMKGLTRWEQLKEEFNRIGVRYVDLSVPLLASKEHEELFYKKDTHWNGKGSMLAYNYLLREIAKDVPTIRCFSIDELTAVVRDNEKSDLNRMIGMGDQHDASHIDFIKEGMQELPVKIQRGVPLVLKGLNEEAPSVLLYHDSFAFKWGPYFYNYFSEATSVWYPLMDLNYIESRKPDIVIHQMVERFLTHGI